MLTVILSTIAGCKVTYYYSFTFKRTKLLVYNQFWNFKIESMIGTRKIQFTVEVLLLKWIHHVEFDNEKICKKKISENRRGNINVLVVIYIV